MTFDPENPLAPIGRETDSANRALHDYARMGKRSYRVLLENYQQQSKENPTYNPPTLKWNTLTTWTNKYNWQERVKAFDKLEAQRQKEAFQAERDAIYAVELADYKLQHEKWKDVWQRTHIHEIRSRRTVTDENGNQREIEVVELNISDFSSLTRWRADISKQGRLALGLPDKITQQDHGNAKDEKGNVKPIQFIEVMMSEDENNGS